MERQMAKLLPLSSLPYCAREMEARERAKWPTREMALDAASYRIIDAPGTYGGAFPGTRGWVLTEDAAEAICAYRCRMPGGTSHALYDYSEESYASDALGEYVEAVARGVPESEALAAYTAARAAA